MTPRFFVRLPCVDRPDEATAWALAHGLDAPTLHPCFAGIVGVAEVGELEARRILGRGRAEAQGASS